MSREYIQQRLWNWARWLGERWSGGLGFPKSNILAANHGSSASTDVWHDVIPVDSIAASETHAAVRQLCLSQSHLWLAVTCRYVGDPQAPAHRRRPMTHIEIGRRLGVTDQTSREYVRQAEVFVDEALSPAARASRVSGNIEKP